MKVRCINMANTIYADNLRSGQIYTVIRQYKADEMWNGDYPLMYELLEIKRTNGARVWGPGWASERFQIVEEVTVEPDKKEIDFFSINRNFA